MSGQLYLVATPIGNLEDMSPRAVRTLQEADLIAAEDTRGSIKLLNRFDIHTPMTSYHEYNRVEKAKVLIGKLQEGMNIALVTDAGTPGISDPGEVLVAMCREAGIPVTSIPGPAALINALVISGLPTRRFCFEAFLPTEKKQRQQILEELQRETRTIILYEAPHRLLKTLEQLREYLGDRSCGICRELTKLHETVFNGTLGEAVEHFTANEPRGEFVLVIEGRDLKAVQEEKQEAWKEMSLAEHMQLYLDQDMDRKAAMKAVAKDRGVGKREIYQALLEEEEK